MGELFTIGVPVPCRHCTAPPSEGPLLPESVVQRPWFLMLATSRFLMLKVKLKVTVGITIETFSFR